MKYLLMACLALVLCGCPQPQRPKMTIEPIDEGLVIKKLRHYNYELEIKEFEYDGCQYISIGNMSQLGVTHKGNCKYCQNRNK